MEERREWFEYLNCAGNEINIIGSNVVHDPQRMNIIIKDKKIIYYLKGFLKCARYFIFFITVIILGILLISHALEWTSSRDFITIYPVLKIIIFSNFVLIATIIFYKKVRLYINEHSAVTNFLLVVFTIIFTLSAYFIDRQNQFYNTNTFLVRTNGINILIGKEIIEKSFPWADFITEPYEENISFISKNFISSECVTDYYSAMMQMRIANKINNNIVESLPWTQGDLDKFNQGYVSRKSDIDYYASTTIGLLQKLNDKCHSAGISDKSTFFTRITGVINKWLIYNVWLTK